MQESRDVQAQVAALEKSHAAYASDWDELMPSLAQCVRFEWGRLKPRKDSR
jgi:hypothetical protein